MQVRDKLKKLHEKITDYWLMKFESGKNITPRELEVIVKFLKDNEIVATGETTISAVNSVLQHLREKKQKSKIA